MKDAKNSPFKRLFQKEKTLAELRNESLIVVDRTTVPVYPGWMKEIVDPEQESTGPKEIEVAKLKLWTHESQEKNRRTRGEHVYEYLTKHDMVKDCLNFCDLLEILKKGPVFFKKYFGKNIVFGWRTIIRDNNDDLYAPVLYVSNVDKEVHYAWQEFCLILSKTDVTPLIER